MSSCPMLRLRIISLTFPVTQTPSPCLRSQSFPCSTQAASQFQCISGHLLHERTACAITIGGRIEDTVHDTAKPIVVAGVVPCFLRRLVALALKAKLVALHTRSGFSHNFVIDYVLGTLRAVVAIDDNDTVINVGRGAMGSAMRCRCE